MILKLVQQPELPMDQQVSRIITTASKHKPIRMPTQKLIQAIMRTMKQVMPMVLLIRSRVPRIRVLDTLTVMLQVKQATTPIRLKVVKMVRLQVQQAIQLLI